MKNDVTQESKMGEIKSFILDNISKQKEINTVNSSYGIKQIIEKYLGFYVSNDECICAFTELGFNVLPDGINAYTYFNTCQNDIWGLNAKLNTK